MSDHQINIAVKGKDEGAGSMLDNLAKRAKLLKKEETASGERSLERLIKQGPEGIGKLLGIANLGIATVIADKLGESMSKVAETMVKFQEGKIHIADMADSMVRALPAVGALYGGFHDLIGAIDGTTEAEDRKIKEMERDTSRATAAMKDFVAVHKELKAIDEGLVKEGRELGHVGESAADKRKRTEDERYADQKKKLQEEVTRIKGSNMTGPEKDAAIARLEGSDHTDVIQENGKEVSRKTTHVKGEMETAEELHQKAMLDIQQEGAIAQGELVKKTGQQLGKEQAENHALQLEREGRMLDAEIVRIQESGEERKQALQKQVDDAMKAGTATQDFYQQVADEMAGVDQEVSGKIGDATKKDQEEQDKKAEDEAAAKKKQFGESRQTTFHAELLSNRYQGLAARTRDPVAENTGSMKTTLSQMLVLMKQSGGAARVGFLLRA